MDFGIMSFQKDYLIPAGLPADQLMAQLGGSSHTSLIRTIADQGFRLIELSGDLEMLLPHFYSPESLAQLAALKTELGLAFTVHLPLWSVEPSTPLTAVRNGSVQAIVAHIRTVAPLAPEVYVLHATGALAAEFYRMDIPGLVKNFLLSQFYNGARESIRTILTETGIPSQTLAIETIEFPFEMTLALAEELDLSICFDTGHILAGFSGDVEFFDALERALPRIAEIHLHDCPVNKDVIGYGKDHQTLGKGDLDTQRFLNRLVEFGFDGPVIFELTIEEALKSQENIATEW